MTRKILQHNIIMAAICVANQRTVTYDDINFSFDVF